MVLSDRASLVEAIKKYLSKRPRNGITDEIIAATKEGPVERRTFHIEVVGELAPGEVREDLADLLGDTETQVRVAAAAALAGLDDAGAEAELVRLLDDPRPAVRIEALRGLARRTSRLSTMARMSAIEDEDPGVRQAAMQSFMGSDDDAVLEVLERVVRSGTHDERLTALTAISEIRTRRAAVMLVDLVTESDEAVKKAAVAYFGTLPKLSPRYENAGVDPAAPREPEAERSVPIVE
jgi:HEAT repeat protein